MKNKLQYHNYYCVSVCNLNQAACGFGKLINIVRAVEEIL